MNYSPLSSSSNSPSSPIFPSSIPSIEFLSSPTNTSPIDSFSNFESFTWPNQEVQNEHHLQVPSSSSETLKPSQEEPVQSFLWLQNTYFLTKLFEKSNALVKKRKHTHFSRLVTYLRNKDFKYSSLDVDLFTAPNDPLSEKLEKATQAIYLLSVHFEFPQHVEYIRFSLKSIMDAVPMLQHLPRGKSIWVKIKNQFYYTTCDAKEDRFPKCDNIIELNQDDTISSKKLDNLNGLKAVSPTGAVLEFSLEKFQFYHPNTSLPCDRLHSRIELVCERRNKPNTKKKIDVWSERTDTSFSILNQ